MTDYAKKTQHKVRVFMADFSEVGFVWLGEGERVTDLLNGPQKFVSFHSATDGAWNSLNTRFIQRVMEAR